MVFDRGQTEPSGDRSEQRRLTSIESRLIVIYLLDGLDSINRVVLGIYNTLEL